MDQEAQMDRNGNCETLASETEAASEAEASKLAKGACGGQPWSC